MKVTGCEHWLPLGPMSLVSSIGFPSLWFTGFELSPPRAYEPHGISVVFPPGICRKAWWFAIVPCDGNHGEAAISADFGDRCCFAIRFFGKAGAEKGSTQTTFVHG